MNVSKVFSTQWWATFFSGRSLWQRALSKCIRTFIDSIHGFTEDGCSAKASALTFYSLLSIVPGLAVAFGIAKGFGFEGPLETELLQKFSEHREIAEKLIGFAYNTLEKTKGGVIAGVGLIVLFWSVLNLLSSIEGSFNSIWKLTRSRSLSRRFSDYLAIVLFCPIFFAAASSIFVFLITEFNRISETHGFLDAFGPVMVGLLYLSPLVFAWILFTFLYYVMPNTKVPITSALFAGIVAGTLYQIIQVIYIRFQIELATYGAIYGSFAALPLFLIWLNTSWLIALFGAEMAYHNEIITFPNINGNGQHFHADQRIIALLIMKISMDAFVSRSPPPSLYDLSQHIEIAVVKLRQLVRKLIEAGLLIEARWQGEVGARYVPGCPLDAISFKSVCDALDSSREPLYWITENSQVKYYQETLNKLDSLVEENIEHYPLCSIKSTE